MSKSLKVGILGGSIAGCTAAILLSRAGHDVTVFERNKGVLHGRGSGVTTPIATFRSLISEDLIEGSFPHTVATEMPLMCRISADDRWGRTAWTLPIRLACFHWGALWDNLRKRVPDEKFRSGSTVSGVRMHGREAVVLAFEDGSRHEFDLVIAADGSHSLGRSMLFPEVRLSYRGYILWRGLLPEARMDNGQALGVALPRLTYPDSSGHMAIYLLPGYDGSVKVGQRLYNWEAFIPVAEDDLPGFMTDRHGERRIGSLPPETIRPEAEKRLNRLLADNLPGYYAEIVAKTEYTSVQLIYTAELPGYARGRTCLVGDAGAVVQPFTGSGIYKGFNNVRDLVSALQGPGTIDSALRGWSLAQVQRSHDLLALGEQMEHALIRNPLDFAKAGSDATAAWWKAAVTFPEKFNCEDRGQAAPSGRRNASL